MRSYETSIDIGAEPERIWQLLTDAPGYSKWNAAVERIEGRIAQGETIKVHAPINPGRTFSIRVAEMDAPRRMAWTSGMPLGLFRGTRTFELTPSGTGQTRFAMREVYTGLLAGVMFRQIPDLTEAFAEFAASLKQAAESPATTGG